MDTPEYLGPLCRHVCMVCGGCLQCCGGHDTPDPAPEG
jgi:hypothetical protein